MSQDIKKILAKNVKELREKKGKNREEISLAIGVDNSYISKLERSKINATIDKLVKLAEYFEVDFVDLFRE